MRSEKLEHILRDHKLRVTETRLKVLEYIVNSHSAIDQKQLESNFKDFDNVTLYRTLGSFTDKGILHRIADENGSISFGLCYDTCSSDNHKHNHLHFKCDICEKVECLEDVVPFLTLPKGYKLRNSNLLLNGVCPECNN